MQLVGIGCFFCKLTSVLRRFRLPSMLLAIVAAPAPACLAQDNSFMRSLARMRAIDLDTDAPVSVALVRGPWFMGRTGWDFDGTVKPGPEYSDSVLVLPFWERQSRQPSGALRLWCHLPTKKWGIEQVVLSPYEGKYFDDCYFRKNPNGSEMAIVFVKGGAKIELDNNNSTTEKISEFQGNRDIVAPLVSLVGKIGVFAGLEPQEIDSLQGVFSEDSMGDFRIHVFQTSFPALRRGGKLRVTLDVQRADLSEDMTRNLFARFAELSGTNIISKGCEVIAKSAR